VEAPAVGVRVEADAAARVDPIVAVDDSPAQPRPAADRAVVHDHAILQLDVLLDQHLAPDDRVADRTAPHKCTGADVAALDPAVEDVRRRPLMIARPDRPARVEEVEARLGTQRVHGRREIRVDRAHVAPVGALLLVAHAGHPVLREVVGEQAVRRRQPRQDVPPEVLFAPLARFAQRAHQRLRAEDVVAHRGVNAARIARHRRRFGRLLHEALDAPARLAENDAERGRLVERHR
jgi:hypothetical protein